MSEQKDEPVAEMSHAICAVKARVDEELQHGPIGWNLTQMDVVLADTLMSVSKTLLLEYLACLDPSTAQHWWNKEFGW